MDSNTAAIDPTPHLPSGFTQQEHQFEFRGSGNEYFRIWIVNLLLSVLTLGIYSAWAKVRRLRYFYGNTVLDGSSFEYHGEPLSILKGRIIAASLILPYSLCQRSYPLVSLLFLGLFLIALPFIIVQSRRFQMRMTSWRNVRFGFDGRYGTAAGTYLGLHILLPFTLGLLFPYVQFAKQRFLIGETRFGGTKFEFKATAERYYLAYVVAIGAWLLCVLVGVLLTAGVFFGFAAIISMSPEEIFNDPKAVFSAYSPGIIVWGGLTYLGLIASSMVPKAVVVARLTNEAFHNTRVGPHQLQCSLFVKQLLGVYFSNLLLTMLTFGLYSPWAKVRLLRYQLEHTKLIASSDMSEFAATESATPSATGEELGNFLDLDFGL